MLQGCHCQRTTEMRPRSCERVRALVIRATGRMCVRVCHIRATFHARSIACAVSGTVLLICELQALQNERVGKVGESESKHSHSWKWVQINLHLYGFDNAAPAHKHTRSLNVCRWLALEKCHKHRVCCEQSEKFPSIRMSFELLYNLLSMCTVFVCQRRLLSQLFSYWRSFPSYLIICICKMTVNVSNFAMEMRNVLIFNEFARNSLFKMHAFYMRFIKKISSELRRFFFKFL